MNPKIIHLEPYDDVHVVIDHMDQTRLERIILVFPTRRAPLANRLDLLLLQRHAADTGKQIAVVTNSSKLVEYSLDLGIPVFPSIRQAQTSEWKSTPITGDKLVRPEGQNRRSLEWLQANHQVSKSVWQDNPTLRYGVIAGCALAILTLMVFLLPSAEITLTPKTELQEIHMTVKANPALSSYTLTGELPAKRVTTVVEGREEMQASGSIMVPLQPASGEVVFTNLSDQEIDIPVGSIVRTSQETPVRFNTQESASLPAQAGATISVPVQALNPGISGNLPADSLNIVEGDLKLFVTVTNPEPTQGGSQQESIAPSEKDYEALSNKLRASLWQSAVNEVKSELAPNDLIIDSIPLSMKVLEEIYDPPEPQPASTLSLQMRVEYVILVVAGDDMQNMIGRNLDATLPKGYTASPASLVILPETEPEIGEDEVATWTVYAQRWLYANMDNNEIRESAAGKTRGKASTLLQTMLDLDSPPQIKCSPGWWPVLPWLPIRITIDNAIN